MYDISVILGSKNRKNLLKQTINSIRNNGFSGKMEIIVIDGGSTDGTCNWLSKQRDILTIIQPNFKITDNEGISVLNHSWGAFMNIAFKYSSADWIVMLSDDLLLEKGCLELGYNELTKRTNEGEKIGGGAFYFREYPRFNYYRVIVLPSKFVNINHGFYNRQAIKEINYFDEETFNFYCADGDLAMRLNNSNWKTVDLLNCFSNHLVHKPVFKKNKYSLSTLRDISRFHLLYGDNYHIHELVINKYTNLSDVLPFWKYGFSNCLYGCFSKIYDNNFKQIILKKLKYYIKIYFLN